MKFGSLPLNLDTSTSREQVKSEIDARFVIATTERQRAVLERARFLWKYGYLASALRLAKNVPLP